MYITQNLKKKKAGRTLYMQIGGFWVSSSNWDSGNVVVVRLAIPRRNINNQGQRKYRRILVFISYFHVCTRIEIIKVCFVLFLHMIIIMSKGPIRHSQRHLPVLTPPLIWIFVCFLCGTSRHLAWYTKSRATVAISPTWRFPHRVGNPGYGKIQTLVQQQWLSSSAPQSKNAVSTCTNIEHSRYRPIHLMSNVWSIHFHTERLL